MKAIREVKINDTIIMNTRKSSDKHEREKRDRKVSLHSVFIACLPEDNCIRNSPDCKNNDK